MTHKKSAFSNPKNQQKTLITHPFYSYILVSLQFLWIAMLLLITTWPLTIWQHLLQIPSVLLGLWALKTMHLGHFNIIPDPMPDLKLVTYGPYAYIRHPMYAAILCFFLPILYQASLWQLATFSMLTLTLLIKLSYEEHLLLNLTQDYAAYRTRTHKLLPKVF